MLSSEIFLRSNKLSRFLRYVVDETLAGNASKLKEFSIGLGAYDRSPSYEPQADPIVRVEAGRLRSKIRDYYDAAGKDDPVQITLAKRGYRPLFRKRKRRRAGAAVPVARENAEALPQTGKEHGRSIAVLPFADLSERRNQAYFCEALTQQITNALAQIQGLQVAGRTSARQFKDKADDLRRIGRDLDVRYILEGSAQRAGDHVRVTAQLFSAVNGLDVWAETYDRPLDNVFALQDEISEQVVSAIKAKLLDSADKPLAELEHPCKETYDDFLKGLHYLERRSADELRTAIECFRNATARDADYAPAFAGLAASYVVMGISAQSRPSDVMPKAQEAAREALKLDPNSARAWSALGLEQALYEWDWPAAQESFERAIRLHPTLSMARHWYAVGSLLPAGRLDDALQAMREAQRLNPPSVIINTHLGLVHYMRREWEEALSQFELVLDMEPHFYRAWWDLGRTYMMLGRFDEAVKTLKKADEESTGRFRQGALGLSYALAGDRARARRLLADLRRASKNHYVSPYELAEILLGLDELDELFVQLERACEERSPWLVWVGVDPALDQIKSDPRLRDILRRIGIPKVANTRKPTAPAHTTGATHRVTGTKTASS